MAKEKSPKELGEIMSEQLDNLRKPGIDIEVVRVSEAVANMIGKIQKQSALEIMYAQVRKTPIGEIPSLER